MVRVSCAALRIPVCQVSGLLVVMSLLLNRAGAQPSAAPAGQGAQLLKTDIMAVFAHPDDETGMAATLANYALGKRVVIANVYCTRGEGGGNMVGTQAGPALATLREVELRACLAVLGIRYCYFLDQLDWAYTESLSATLRKWGKEQTLERLVRLVRALRPEIILTMNPAPTPGQHGHHQAAAVLATEAFAAAADPNRFPLQLTREGLSVWQPRKLYFGGESTGVIATIRLSDPLPSGKTPGEIAAEALKHHRSQGFGNFGNSSRSQRPQKFTLVKSFIPVGRFEDDLFKGLPATRIAEFHFAAQPSQPALELEFIPRPAFANYRKWAREQHIEHVVAQFRADLPLICGEPNDVILQMINRGAAAVEGDLQIQIGEGWLVQAPAQIRTPAGVTKQIHARVTPPINARKDISATVTFSARGGELTSSATLHPLPHTDVMRVKEAPTMDGSDAGWEKLPLVGIGPGDAYQGKVTDDEDSSAMFRLGHDDKTLFLDVQVKDDVVVTNIAPNDIKGHWRSDSIEICLDPAGGAEDTMACYKLGIFPFDTTGVVRAARDADANQGPVEETAPKTRLVSRRTPEGYRIQVAIPFEEIAFVPGLKKRLGFNLIVYDGDKRDAALGENINKSRIAWAPRPGVMGRPEDWGRLDLE